MEGRQWLVNWPKSSMRSGGLENWPKSAMRSGGLESGHNLGRSHLSSHSSRKENCQNYRTFNLISHASKVILKVILNGLKPQAYHSRRAGWFSCGRSTTKQIFNIRVLCEKNSQQQQDIYHVFIDFKKKVFDRVCLDALLVTLNKYNMGQKLINTIK